MQINFDKYSCSDSQRDQYDDDPHSYGAVFIELRNDLHVLDRLFVGPDGVVYLHDLVFVQCAPFLRRDEDGVAIAPSVAEDAVMLVHIYRVMPELHADAVAYLHDRFACLTS